VNIYNNLNTPETLEFYLCLLLVPSRIELSSPQTFVFFLRWLIWLTGCNSHIIISLSFYETCKLHSPFLLYSSWPAHCNHLSLKLESNAFPHTFRTCPLRDSTLHLSVQKKKKKKIQQISSLSVCDAVHTVNSKNCSFSRFCVRTPAQHWPTQLLRQHHGSKTEKEV